MLVCFCVGQLAFTDSLTFSCDHWSTGITHTCFYTWLYMNYKDLDSGSHIYMANALPLNHLSSLKFP